MRAPPRQPGRPSVGCSVRSADEGKGKSYVAWSRLGRGVRGKASASDDSQKLQGVLGGGRIQERFWGSVRGRSAPSHARMAFSTERSHARAHKVKWTVQHVRNRDDQERIG